MSSAPKRSQVDSEGNPRGGRRQRLRYHEANENPPESLAVHVVVSSSGFVFDSEQALGWVQEWSWQGLSSIQVQKYAHKAYKDQIELLDRLHMSHSHVLTSISMLASLGSWGRLPGNANAELKAMLGAPDLPLHDLYRLNCKIQKPRCRIVSYDTKDFPFVLPHVVISYLYNHHRAVFLKKFPWN